jgi:hypothetical protein
MREIFAVTPIVVSLLIGAGGAILALIVRLIKGDGVDSLFRTLETFLTGTFGAFLAHSFIYLMLAAGKHSPLTVTLTSLFFFIWPGLINVVSQVVTHHPVIGETAVLNIALAVGGAVGVMDGLWATHDWKGLGWIAFPLDVTWGLGGSTNGVLLHVINFAWADHADDPDTENRHEAHRYKSGFRLKGRFVFTQGAVMSNAQDYTPGSDLFLHETLHVWQNRVLGPLYWFSYMSWVILFFVPSLIAGGIGSEMEKAITWWTYYNNPWEVMAYGIADASDRTGADGGDKDWLCWPWAVAIVVGAAVTIGFGAIFVFLFAKAY